MGAGGCRNGTATVQRAAMATPMPAKPCRPTRERHGWRWHGPDRDTGAAEHAPGRSRTALSADDTAACWNSWRAAWEASELRPEQRRLRANKRASIFNAYVWNIVGGTQLINMVLQLGQELAASTAAGAARDHARRAAEASEAAVAAVQAMGVPTDA